MRASVIKTLSNKLELYLQLNAGGHHGLIFAFNHWDEKRSLRSNGAVSYNFTMYK